LVIKTTNDEKEGRHKIKKIKINIKIDKFVIKDVLSVITRR
jgi:hypothetical protein